MDKVTSNFLSQASQSLLQASPSTSAHLSFSDLERSERLDRRMSRGACSACGTLLVPGLTCNGRIERSNSVPKPKQLAKGPGNRNSCWVFRCTRCGRNNRHAVSSSKPINARSRGRVAETSEIISYAQDTPHLPEHQPPTRPGAKLSSKKRAKARNDRSSLQTLLSKAKTSSTSSALTFSDLMKR
jgi:RNase P subunit RPR2